ncbi:NAD(P)/FAD-dependent oxidoreductase [Nocardia arthritidis]|uniref:FAD-binding protein n=1 Tax=Nocardia arthritidis TaxID=228602 RepID=A0A6G9YPF5_9NOCA|nr:NAD(P)/FAD-dependent oxidoreductase [Nocardia arthritidis]QIS15094.1 FAD-binding protein [Nocardia arthritidis]
MRSNETNGEVWDAVLIGGGAAGLSAAVALGRAGRKIVVVDDDSPRNAPAEQVHAFLTRDGMPPAELLLLGRAEASGYGAKLLDGRAISLSWRGEEPGFVIGLDDGADLVTRAVLVSTGLRDELPDIPGLRERWGKDVLHCPYCHGFEVRDQPIGLLGGGDPDLSVAHAQLIRQWSNDLVYFPGGLELTGEHRNSLAARDIRVVDGEVARVVTVEDRLRGLELTDGRAVPRRALFVTPRMTPHDELLRAIGCDIDETGYVTVDSLGATSVPGVFAAGNVADFFAQVINAAAAGNAAGAGINRYLVELDVAAARAKFRPEQPFSAALEQLAHRVLHGDDGHGL